MDDVEAITIACQDESIAYWTSSMPYPYERADAESFINHFGTDEEPVFGIYPHGENQLVGVVGLHDHSKGVAELGFWMAPEYRSKGLLTEAVKAVCAFGFEQLHLQRIVWKAHVGNWASRKVAWKCGFVYEGTARNDCVGSHLWSERNGGAQRGAAWQASLLPDDAREPSDVWMGPVEGQEVAVVLADCHRPNDLVRQFHQVYSLPVKKVPSLATDRIHMRMGLILEETAELVGAVYGDEAQEIMESAWTSAHSVDDGTRNLVETADALGDIVYVVYGMALEMGIDLPAVLSQIQASNMSKLMPDGSVKLRDDGKVLKGPDYFRPEIAKILGIERN